MTDVKNASTNPNRLVLERDRVILAMSLEELWRLAQDAGLVADRPKALDYVQALAIMGPFNRDYKQEVNNSNMDVRRVVMILSTYFNRADVSWGCLTVAHNMLYNLLRQSPSEAVRALDRVIKYEGVMWDGREDHSHTLGAASVNEFCSLLWEKV